jgi:hypothetical protein|tara:strand:+ start:291 stop:527 length:237 start_codon:yes stop_codon:yes gene_type:complete
LKPTFGIREVLWSVTEKNLDVVRCKAEPFKPDVSRNKISLINSAFSIQKKFYLKVHAKINILLPLIAIISLMFAIGMS